MAFDKKAYNKWYYETHKYKWDGVGYNNFGKNNGVETPKKNTMGSAIQSRIDTIRNNGAKAIKRDAMGSAIQSRIDSMKVDRRTSRGPKSTTLLTPGYKGTGKTATKSTTVTTNPDYRVNTPVTEKPKSTSHVPEPYSGKKISTMDWEYVNKKMKQAQADASYKQGRRSMRSGASEATTQAYLSERRQAKERQQKYEGKHIHNTHKPKKKSGIIPRAIRSYARNYKIGIKDIGSSIASASSKAAKKAKKFYTKWLKW